MLKQMREGAKSTVLKVVLFGMLLLAMAGLAIMDVQGMFRGGVSNNTVAKFGGSKLTAPEFDRLVQQAVRQKNMRQSEAYRAGLPLQVLKQEIDNRLVSLAARDLGIEVGDELVAKQVKEILKPMTEKGMSEKEALQRLLQSYEVSEGQMIGTLKSQIASQQLINMIVSGAHAPQQLVSDVLKYRYESRRGEYIRLTPSDIGAVKEPSEGELKAYYETIAGEYALPEYRTLSVIVLDQKALGDAALVTPEKLKQHYDENIADYKTPESRSISQAVAQDEAVAKQVYEAATKTKKLQQATAAAGKDKANFLKASSYTEEAMPAELSKTAFAGEAGKVLPPVKSPLGWHVLYIEKVTPASTRSFETVKADIEKELVQDKISEAIYTRATEIDDEIAGGKALSDVARENNIHETVLQKIDARGLGVNGKKPDVTIPLFDKVVESGFALQKGGASPLIETPEGAFLIVGAKEIFPSEQRSFEKARTDVLARWKADHQIRALSDKAAQLTEQLKKGESFEKIAADLKKSMQQTELVQRGTPENKTKMSKNLISALFSIAKTGEATTISDDNAVTLLRLSERKVPQPQDIGKEDRESTEAFLGRSLQQDLMEQYRQILMEEYNVSINDRLVSELYTPKDDVTPGGEE